MSFLKKCLDSWDEKTGSDISCITDTLSFLDLLEAYKRGFFPWPEEEGIIPWFSPRKRGVLELENYHMQKSFLKFLPKISKTWTVTFNSDFQSVIKACRQAHEDTWITQDIQEAYVDLFKNGYAYSVECREAEELIGGLYGVYVKGVVSAESMFYKKSEASKVCLWALKKTLENQDITWIDLQMVTDFTASLGAELISRHEFYERFRKSSPGTLVWPEKKLFVESYLDNNRLDA